MRRRERERKWKKKRETERKVKTERYREREHVDNDNNDNKSIYIRFLNNPLICIKKNFAERKVKIKTEKIYRNDFAVL